MSNHTLYPIYLTLFLGLFLTSCGGNTEEKKKDFATTIQGSWILKKAFRDKKETVALENTFFEFDKGGTMKTNFNVDMKTESHPFTMENNIIRQQGTDILTYHIYEASDTSLTLQTRYKGFEFKLIMEKNNLEGRE